MSKRDLGIFDENDVRWESSLFFKLESFLSFKSKVKTGKLSC